MEHSSRILVAMINTYLLQTLITYYEARQDWEELLPRASLWLNIFEVIDNINSPKKWF